MKDIDSEPVSSSKQSNIIVKSSWTPPRSHLSAHPTREPFNFMLTFAQNFLFNWQIRLWGFFFHLERHWLVVSMWKVLHEISITFAYHFHDLLLFIHTEKKGRKDNKNHLLAIKINLLTFAYWCGFLLSASNYAVKLWRYAKIERFIYVFFITNPFGAVTTIVSFFFCLPHFSNSFFPRLICILNLIMRQLKMLRLCC